MFILTFRLWLCKPHTAGRVQDHKEKHSSPVKAKLHLDRLNTPKQYKLTILPHPLEQTSMVELVRS